MNLSSEELREFTEQAYDLSRDERGLSPIEDLSNSNLCSLLSMNLRDVLTENGHGSRRELHITPNGSPHFLVAHSAPGDTPSAEDFISDLNPWQYGPPTLQIGALHGPRAAVQETLRQKGAPDWFISLRGITTLYEAHSQRKRLPLFRKLHKRPPRAEA